MEGYLNEMGIRRGLTTTLWPRANEEVERQNRSLLKAMVAVQVEKKDWRSELNKYLLAYRSTPHTITGKSPTKLLYGRKLSTRLPEVADFDDSDEATHPEVRNRDADRKQRGADYVDTVQLISPMYRRESWCCLRNRKRQSSQQGMTSSLIRLLNVMETKLS
ncbi:uncharacterized protein [Montipora foliosa]|uniref:uncharacterized protein n=1 Tax=Montipora foliosa TaxID=591990 RepID=UPI0035F1FC67